MGKIVSMPVKSLPDVLQTSSVIGTATNDTNTVSIRSLVSKSLLEWLMLPQIIGYGSLLWFILQININDSVLLRTTLTRMIIIYVLMT